MVIACSFHLICKDFSVSILRFVFQFVLVFKAEEGNAENLTQNAKQMQSKTSAHFSSETASNASNFRKISIKFKNGSRQSKQ